MRKMFDLLYYQNDDKAFIQLAEEAFICLAEDNAGKILDLPRNGVKGGSTIIWALCYSQWGAVLTDIPSV